MKKSIEIKEVSVRKLQQTIEVKVENLSINDSPIIVKEVKKEEVVNIQPISEEIKNSIFKIHQFLINPENYEESFEKAIKKRNLSTQLAIN